MKRSEISAPSPAIEHPATRENKATEEEGYERLEFFPVRDKSGKRCFVSFTSDELSKNPQLKTDARARQAWMDAAPLECLQYPPSR